MDLKQILSLDISEENQKRVREVRGDLLKKARTIHERAEAEDRQLTDAELAEIERCVDYTKVIDKRVKDAGYTYETTFKKVSPDELDAMISGKRINLGNGQALNEDGSIRMYRSGEKISADVPNEYPEVNLGSFLRAVIDKPRTDAERRAIQNSVDSSGYTLPSYVSSELINLLRARNPVIAAGARTITLDGLDKTSFIRIKQDPASIWHSELTDEKENFDDPVFDAVVMAPKTVLAMTEISRELLADAANIDEALTNAFVGSINTAILNATFADTTANGPDGLGSVVTQTETYASGANPDWSQFVKASSTLHANNVPEDSRSFIYAPDVWEHLALETDDNGRYQDAPSFIRDVPSYTSSGVPAGVSYAGDFSEVVYGFRMNITLEQHRGVSAHKFASVWLAAARLDIGVFRPSALVRIEEAEA